ncbi:hypothetical protein [Janthinobacterium sp. PC23-8]|uniref:hypothetical protein n=1 Tax=Janthinobacterium sp. PC23-8 TaxID=2012679 RepID=UPI00114020EB|nr:hypothetical protein [Janthinobacterium sp. PC23-8]
MMHSTSSKDDIGDGNSRNDTATAQLVEQGVEFHKVLGRTVATAYLKEHHVPTEVIYRILSSSAARRQSPPSRTPSRY